MLERSSGQAGALRYGVGMPRPTLAAIAARAGVSRSTAAYILNGAPAHITFADATRERVEAVARELGYRPHRAARATATGRTGVIAVLHAGGALPGELLWALHDRLAQRGYALRLSRLPDPRLVAPDHVPDVLAEVGADGVLVAGGLPEAVRAACVRLAVPAIGLGGDATTDVVAADEAAAGRDAAEHCLRLGHRRIAVVVDADPVAAARAAGAAEALRAAGGRLLTIGPDADLPAAIAATLARTDRPTALLAAAPFADVVRGFAGLRIPADASLVAFAPQPLRLGALAVTTHVEPHAALARAAVDLLLARLTAPTPLPALRLAGALAVGRTTAPPT